MDLDKIGQEAVVIGSIEGETALEMIALIRKQEQALADSNLALLEQTELAEKLRQQAETLEAELRVARAACDAQGDLTQKYQALALNAAQSPTIKQLSAQLESDEKWTIAEQQAFAPFLAQFPNESSQGILSLGSAWQHGIAYAQSLAATPAVQASAPQQHAQEVLSVKVERNRVWIVKGVQSFMLAYEADTTEELNWYADQLRAILASQQPAAAPSAAVANDDGPEFTVDDPDLDALLNAVADWKTTPQNMDTGLHLMSLLERVEDRLKAATLATPSIQQEGAALDDEPSDIEAVIACLGDDAARLQESEPEVADNMRAAERLLEALSAQVKQERAPYPDERLPLYDVALTDEDIVKVLHSLAIDTFPSAYGFPETQVSGTNVPSIRRIVARCNRIIAEKDRPGRAALASQASKGAGVPEDMLKKITQDRDWYKAAHDAASGKLASVWKGIEEAVEKFSGEPCKGEPFDRLDELLTRLAAPSPAQANAGPLPGDMPIDRLIASMPLPTYEPAQAQPVADAAPVDMGLVLAAQRDLTPPAAVQQGSERAQELSEYIDKMQENGDVDIMVDRLQDWLDGDSTNMHAIVKNYEPKANQDSERDAALEDAAKAAEHHELAEKLARMTMANPVGHALSLTRTIAAAIRALATKPADQP